MLTGDISISVTPNEKTTNFASMLPDYKNVLRAPFCKWVENALPSEYDKAHSINSHCSTVFPVHEGLPDVMVGNQKYVIELQKDGFPCLPIFDLDHIAPNDAQLMLKTYLEFMWSESRIA